MSPVNAFIIKAEEKMATQADINKGAQALMAYVQSVDGWEANLVPWSAYASGAQIVITKWDSIGAADNPDALALKKATCGMALYTAIYHAGYGQQITAEQCAAGADAVLAVTRGVTS